MHLERVIALPDGRSSSLAADDNSGSVGNASLATEGSSNLMEKNPQVRGTRAFCPLPSPSPKELLFVWSTFINIYHVRK